MSPISGNAPTSVASQKPGSVTERTTVVITQMRTVLIVPAGLALQASLNVTMVAASPRPGSVMWMMTVAIIQMSQFTNAVSRAQLVCFYICYRGSDARVGFIRRDGIDVKDKQQAQ